MTSISTDVHGIELIVSFFQLLVALYSWALFVIAYSYIISERSRELINSKFFWAPTPSTAQILNLLEMNFDFFAHETHPSALKLLVISPPHYAYVSSQHRLWTISTTLQASCRNFLYMLVPCDKAGLRAENLQQYHLIQWTVWKSLRVGVSLHTHPAPLIPRSANDMPKPVRTLLLIASSFLWNHSLTRKAFYDVGTVPIAGSSAS